MRFYTSSTPQAFQMAANGACTWNVSVGQASDTSLKDDQQIANLDDIMNVFNAVEPKTFIRNDIAEEFTKGTRRLGFIAQDVETAMIPDFQNLVSDSTLGENSDGSDRHIKCIHGDGLVAILWGVCKKQKQQIESIEARLAALENK